MSSDQIGALTGGQFADVPLDLTVVERALLLSHSLLATVGRDARSDFIFDDPAASTQLSQAAEVAD